MGNFRHGEPVLGRAPRPASRGRKRCSDPKETGCRGFARRNTVPPLCEKCGAGTRTEQRHEVDSDTGEAVTTRTGKVNVPPRIMALLDGTISVEDLDDEELARGYPRAVDGTFKGSAPKLVPRALHDRMVRELFARADLQLRNNLLKVTETMTRLATDPEVDDSVRLKAATYVYERLRGKVPDVVVTTTTKPWEEVLEGVYRGPRTDVVEGEVVHDGREP